MTEPSETAPATQTRHPWHAIRRTLVAIVPPLVALLALLPLILETSGLAVYPAAAAVLAWASAVTRVLALPGVNAWLQRNLPSIAAAPPSVPPWAGR